MAATTIWNFFKSKILTAFLQNFVMTVASLLQQKNLPILSKS